MNLTTASSFQAAISAGACTGLFFVLKFPLFSTRQGNKMARRTTASNLATVDGDGEVIDPAAPAAPGFILDENDPPDIALETALMQLGQETDNGARVIIYRLVKDGGKPVEEWLHETTPGDFNEGGLSWIAKEWGAGTYRVRIFVPGERGFRSNKVVRVAAPKDTAPVTAAPAAGFTELANVMMQGFQKLGEMIAAGQQKPQATEEDMLRKLSMYKELFAQPLQPVTSPEPGFGAMFEVLKQGMEMGRMGAGEPTSMDALMKGLEVLGPILNQAVGQQAAQQAANHPPAPAIAALPAAANPNPLPETESDMNVRAMMLKQSLSFLVAQARKGADPYTYANVVLDQLNDDEVKALLDRADWLDWLAGVNADVKAPGVGEWFQRLRDAIIELLTSEGDTGKDGEHANTAPIILPETDAGS